MIMAHQLVALGLVFERRELQIGNQGLQLLLKRKLLLGPRRRDRHAHHVALRRGAPRHILRLHSRGNMRIKN